MVVRAVKAAWHSWSNGGRYKIIGAALAGAATVLVAVIVYAWVTQPPAPFNPLPPSQVQMVKSRVFGVDGPAVLLGEDVKVTGVRCNRSDQTIQVRGNRVWQTVLPRGTAIAETVFPPAPLIVGCTTFNFRNPMPAEVVERTETLHRQGITTVIWRITGEAVPLDDNGQPGVARPYTTENFQIVVP